MGGFRDALAHAFAVTPEPRERAQKLTPALERAARAVVARGLETPAVLALESLAPLGFLGGQAMLAIWPLVQAVVPGDEWREVATRLEDREALARFARRIEDLARDGRKGAG
jgi:hypothetical protein